MHFCVSLPVSIAVVPLSISRFNLIPSVPFVSTFWAFPSKTPHVELNNLLMNRRLLQTSVRP